MGSGRKPAFVSGLAVEPVPGYAAPMSDLPAFDTPLGPLPVAGLIGGLGDLRSRSLESATGMVMAPEPDDTSMIARCKAAWATPFETLSCEQMRLLIGQGLGVEWLASMAFELLRRRPLAEVTFYPGDLARSLLGEFQAALDSDPISARAFIDRGDFSWIDALLETDRQFGSDFGAETVELLAEARRLAAIQPIRPGGADGG